MDLEPSKLGTKAYWDNFYINEIENFKNNSEDTGECWFDDSDAESRMVEYIEEMALQPRSKVLDLGTGNGHLLFALREAGVEGQFLGIDYSQFSVEFATEVARTNNVEGINFKHHDLLNSSLDATFDLVLDKGTLDAIALSADRSAPEIYAQQIKPLIASNGYFMITSCNFTKPELEQLINLPLYDEIKYPQYQFGGQTGSSVVTLVFTNPSSGSEPVQSEKLEN